MAKILKGLNANASSVMMINYDSTFRRYRIHMGWTYKVIGNYDYALLVTDKDLILKRFRTGTTTFEAREDHFSTLEEVIGAVGGVSPIDAKTMVESKAAPK